MSTSFDSKILEYLARPDARPLSIKGLFNRLELDADDYADYRKAVKALIRTDKLNQGKDKKISLPESDVKATLGTFRRAAKGHGFVRPRSTDASKHNDIYIPADSTRDASTGDVVAVRVLRRARGGFNAEGKVIRVVERASGLFVGAENWCQRR